MLAIVRHYISFLTFCIPISAYKADIIRPVMKMMKPRFRLNNSSFRFICLVSGRNRFQLRVPMTKLLLFPLCQLIPVHVLRTGCFHFYFPGVEHRIWYRVDVQKVATEWIKLIKDSIYLDVFTRYIICILSLSLTATPIFPFFELWKLNLKQLNYLAKIIYEPESALSHFIAHLFLNMSS